MHRQSPSLSDYYGLLQLHLAIRSLLISGLQGKVIVFYIVNSGIHNHLQLSLSVSEILWNGHIKTDSIFHITKSCLGHASSFVTYKSGWDGCSSIYNPCPLLTYLSVGARSLLKCSFAVEPWSRPWPLLQIAFWWKFWMVSYPSTKPDTPNTWGGGHTGSLILP